MEIPDQLNCLFSATLEANNDSSVIEIPTEEIRLGDLEDGKTYRVAIFPAPKRSGTASSAPEPGREAGPETPPVETGDQRDVEIEDIGEQGDGITRVERGFVVIVPDTKQGERVTIEITEVRENVAFADVVERLSYYE